MMEGTGFELRRQTLVHSITRQQGIDRGGRQILSARSFFAEPAEPVPGPDQAFQFAFRIGQSRGDGMRPPDPVFAAAMRAARHFTLV